MSLALFGVGMLAYAGAVAGTAIYLALRGGGPLCLAPPAVAAADGPLERLDRERAQWLVRVLTGATFLWCGVHHKVLQPNLVLAIITEGHVPTFGLGPEAFVLGMALVEVAVGALMTAGVLVRPLALALLAPSLFLSFALGEDPLGHALFYGNLTAPATGGAGNWLPAGERSRHPRRRGPPSAPRHREQAVGRGVPPRPNPVPAIPKARSFFQDRCGETHGQRPDPG